MLAHWLYYKDCTIVSVTGEIRYIIVSANRATIVSEDKYI